MASWLVDATTVTDRLNIEETAKLNYQKGFPELSVLRLQDRYSSARDLGGVACESLSEAGISVHQCSNTRELIASVGLGVHPIVVLDASDAPFPEVGVMSVIALLQSSLHAGILLIAGDTPEDRIRGLNCGADVCLSAPVQGAELVAQVTALHRRLAAYRLSGETLQADRSGEFSMEAPEEALPEVSLLPDSAPAWLVDKYMPHLWTPHAVRVDLTLAEHMLLKEMLRGEHQLLTHKHWALLTGGDLKDQIASKPSRTFHMTISRLRRKVYAATMLSLPVRARHGFGYQFCGRLQEVSASDLAERV